MGCFLVRLIAVVLFLLTCPVFLVFTSDFSSIVRSCVSRPAAAASSSVNSSSSRSSSPGSWCEYCASSWVSISSDASLGVRHLSGWLVRCVF